MRFTALPIVSALIAAAAGAAAAQELAAFRADVRMVEVDATVLDNRGRFMTGLQRDQFTVLDNGEPQRISFFETASAGALSRAILMDTTGSMADDLPLVKNAIIRLIDELPPDSRIAVFTFANSVTTALDFTTDKKLAKQRVLRTSAQGGTALFDAIVQVSHQVAKENGKKFLIVFTDGADNASALGALAATNRAKKVGVPVYAIAQGEAKHNRNLVQVLRGIASQTGGETYRVERSAEIEKVFLDITKEMQHTYMLAYKAPEAPVRDWRRIQVAISGLKGGSIRAKQGYLP